MRLNSQRARWALLFTCFHFTVTFRRGTKNCKADALSRCHNLSDKSTYSEPILPPSIIVTPTCWGLMEEIQCAQLRELPPPECPPTKMFVAQVLRQRTLQWVHNSTCSGHLEIQQTITSLQNVFWWPTLVSDITDFVKACKWTHLNCYPQPIIHDLTSPLISSLIYPTHKVILLS